ncbi:MAG: HEAT repeat domain-containing protein [Bryobacteraceae bacterium]|nr:HEAT repeat domain-containing protein [Bryobacteraceae bacterium]
MKITHGLLIGLTTATLLAQEFPLIDKAQIAMAIEDAKHAQQELLANREVLDRLPNLLAKETMALDRAAFAFQKSFLQSGSPNGGTPLTDDEQLKIMAIDSLMQTDPERAVPLLDKLLQNPQSTVPVRSRAIRALGRSNAAKAREILVRVAKSDANTELRSSAVNQLGGLRASSELSALYSQDASTEVRERILRALASGGEWQKLLVIAKTESNEDLRSRAIRQVGSMKVPGASEALVEMYTSSSDAALRNTILRALSSEGNAKQLIALARRETNPELKRAALQQLSRMKSDEVTTYLMELLEK